MKKTRLLIEHQYDFDLLGLVAPVKDYKMAWLLNHTLGIHLIKANDFELEFVNQPLLKISQYMDQKDHGYTQLLKNRSFSDGVNALYLVPELRFMDYFLLVQDHTFELNINAYIEQLSQVRYIQNVVKLDVNKLKSKDNLLTY
ncbi:IPExxxVDY family protein [Fontibacter flavus]|uniref:IPExxxVDY family protein n=1 Tax=Fontibacter flavus TaxID=654838 RepID=A0ABV6FPM5_9BACT